jgi:hypothetical protein
MIPKTAFFRLLAVPACVVWGLVEFIALQRAHVGQTLLSGTKQLS